MKRRRKSKSNLPNNGLGEIINVDKNGNIFNPEDVVLSEELSLEIHEIITQAQAKRKNLMEGNQSDEHISKERKSIENKKNGGSS
jgi:hypothetical protein